MTDLYYEQTSNKPLREQAEINPSIKKVINEVAYLQNEKIEISRAEASDIAVALEDYLKLSQNRQLKLKHFENRLREIITKLKGFCNAC